MKWQVWLLLFCGIFNVFTALIPGDTFLTALDWIAAAASFIGAGYFYWEDRKRKAALDKSHRDFPSVTSEDYWTRQSKLYQPYRGNRVTAAPAAPSKSDSDWLLPASLGYLAGSSSGSSGAAGLSGGGGSFDGGGASSSWDSSSSSSSSSSCSSSDSGSSSSSDSGSCSSSDSGSSSSSSTD